MGVYYLNESAEDFAETKKHLKLGNKLPQLRFFKNNLFGEDKLAKSFEILIAGKVKLDAVLEEVHDGIEHEVRETSEKILMNVASSHALEEKKTVVFYFYDQGDVSLHVKALSALPIIKESFVFMSVSDPSDYLRDGFKMQQLPFVGGIMPPPPDQPENVRQFSYGGRIDFNEMLQNLLQMIGKEEEYQKQQKDRRKHADRKFEEITSTAQFRANCVDRQKGCAIAFLSGNQIVSADAL